MSPVANSHLSTYLATNVEEFEPLEPPNTRVGPRSFPNLYYGQGCNSTELLRAVSQARIREDGASRFEYEPSSSIDVNAFDLEAFRLSYDRECEVVIHLALSPGQARADSSLLLSS